MADRSLLIRAIVESARSLSKGVGKPLTMFLGDIRDALFQNEIKDGKVCISNTDGGGTTTFALPSGFSPMEVMGLVQEAIDYCNQFSDPNNPPIGTRRIRRLRCNFSQAIPS